MLSVLQALVGLTGLVGSVLLTLGLVHESPRQQTPAPAVALRPTTIHVVEVLPDPVTPDGV